MGINELLRNLPKMDELLKIEEIKIQIEKNGKLLVLESLREAIEIFRGRILKEEILDFSIKEILELHNCILSKNLQPKLRRVINATGVVIHTNLGRSVLSKEAIESVSQVAGGYNNLEYDVLNGARGSRYSHVEELIKKVTGAEAVLVVNNNAAAVLLVLNSLCKDKEAIVSRGQLVEIGGSFRIPDVMTFSGAKLREVGTTNRTHLYDYEDNINENTGVLLKIHTSNFKVLGFTEEVPLEELVALGGKSNLPVIEDIGSGTLIDFSKYGFTYEPTVQESIKKGCDVVTFSGDKMLGGPQAGIIVGKKVYIDKMKKNQLTRALRIDKMTLAALETTFKHYFSEETAIEAIPTLNMLLSSKEKQENRAVRLKQMLDERCKKLETVRLKQMLDERCKKLETVKLKQMLDERCKKLEFAIEEDYSMVGGGSMPTEKIDTYVVKVKNNKNSKCNANFIEKSLRNNKIPIIVRVNKEEIIMDVRTIFDEEFQEIVEAFSVFM